ncbi:MAG: hypothetical protein Q4G63_00220 [Bacteroidia bacterium]|nr:hypothetical protein [Bacteroidia bacterium]
MKSTIKKLSVHFWSSIIVLAILFLLVILKLISFETTFPVTVTAEMYAIGITLIAIPGALKLFADKIKKIPKGTDKVKVIQSFRSAYFLRLYIIDIVVMGNIFLFALSRNNNFMWLTIVLFVVFVFCKPSLNELENIVEEEKR